MPQAELLESNGTASKRCAKLVGKILKRQVDWHLLHHLRFIESHSTETTPNGHDPRKKIEKYLGAGFTFKLLKKDVYYKTFP